MKPAKGTVAALATILGALVLWRVHAALVLLLASLVITAAVGLAVDAFHRRGTPRVLALVLVYVAGLAMMGALVFIIGRAILVEAPRDADHFAAGYDALKSRAPTSHGIVKALIDRLPPSSAVFEHIGGDRPALALDALAATRSLLDGIIFLVLSLVLSVYWAGRGMQVERLVGTIVGPERRKTVFRHWRSVGRLAGQYVRRAIVECALCAVALALAMRLLSVDTWALAAAAAALSLLVPFVGPMLAVAVVLLAGMAKSPTVAIAGAVITVIIVTTLRAWIARRWLPVRRANPLVVIAMAMVLTSALGLVGLIMAPLAAAIASALARRLVAMRVVARVERDELAALTADVQRLGTVVQLADADVPEDVRKLVDRLRQLVLEGEASLAAERDPPLPVVALIQP